MRVCSRGRWLRVVLAVSVGIMLPVVVPSAASASPFVEGEGLHWCEPSDVGVYGSGGVALSGDGNTAISGECVYERSGETWTKQGELGLPPNKGATYFVSFDGTTVIAIGEFPHCCEDRVFVRVGEEWVQQEPVPGQVEAMSGDASTVLADGGTPGVVNVYVRSGEGWTQQAALNITPVQKGTKGEKEASEFGTLQELTGDGNLALISDPGANKGKGGVFVFTRSGETWSQGPFVTTSKGLSLVRRGLSEDGNTAVMYVPKKGYSFWKRSGETWVQQSPVLTAPSKVEKKFFPEDIALSGNGETAIALAGFAEYSKKNGKADPIPEVAYVYQRSGETWSLEQTLTNATERYFGDGYVGWPYGPHAALDSEGNLALIYEGPYLSPLTTTWTR